MTMFNLLAATLDGLGAFFCPFCKLSTTFSFPIQPLDACGTFLPGISPKTFLDALVTLLFSTAVGILETSENIRKAIFLIKVDIFLKLCCSVQSQLNTPH